jgi:lipid-A-disaccharide synthase-like uncharacterized protein
MIAMATIIPDLFWTLGIILAIVGVYFLISARIVVGIVCLIVGLVLLGGIGFGHY